MTTDTINKIEQVPALFKKPDIHHYPKDNWPDFEYWFLQNIKDEEILSDRIYLSILFTSYYKIDCNYGNNKAAINILQESLNSLDTRKKYFCVIQYDDSVLNDISHLDIKVFSMAGGRKDYGLPLICQPHDFIFNNQRSLFCSFVGRITHSVRKKIIESFSFKEGYYISTEDHSLERYCGILSMSVFGLAPQGYGVNSFRIQECIQYGAIPVWISDSFIPIHDLDFTQFGVLIESKDVSRIDEILKAMPQHEIEIKQANGKFVYENYFTFKKNKELILANL